MTWDAYNRRKEALQEVLAIADIQGNADPVSMWNDNESANDVFDSATDMALDVQMNWYQRLSGQLDRALSTGSADLEILTIDAWAHAAAQMPGTRTLLDASESEPELEKALANEYALIARSAGIPLNHPELIAHGRRLRGIARTQVVGVPEIPETPAGLFARIKDALAA